MTNYEHLVETNQLHTFLKDLMCSNENDVKKKYKIPFQATSIVSVTESIARWLESEYVAPVYYVKVDDLINLLYKPERVIQDHVTGSKSTTIRTIDKDMLLSELRLYTKDTINE